MNRFCRLFALPTAVLVSATVSYADDAPQVRASMQWYNTGTFQQLVDTPMNPDNSVLKISDRSGGIDLRPSVKFETGAFQLVARPQLTTTISASQVNNKRQTEHPTSTGKWLEAYGLWNASERAIVSYGLQNYQWGATESYNPSNHIFHETLSNRGIMSTVQGKNIFRVNLTWSKNLTTVIMAETDPYKDEPTFRAEETFESKSLIKNEVNWNSGADYLGIVLGSQETRLPYIGEYFNISLFDGLTFYGDASHEKASQAWYPVVEAGTVPGTNVVEMRQSRMDETGIQTIAVAGLRYSFEGGSDLRAEYIANSAGWTKDQSDLAVQALDRTNKLQLTDYSTNLSRILKPGFDYRGQRYGVLSLRVPDALSLKDLTIILRAMRSLTDMSMSNYGSIEYGFGDASTVLLAAQATTGKSGDELRGVISRSITAGLRQDF